MDGTAPLRAAPPGTPPMIPDAIEGMAITVKDNACLACHTAPAASPGPTASAKAVAKGEPTLLPASHLITVAGRQTVRGGQFECLLCHAPQADVAPLVGRKT